MSIWIGGCHGAPLAPDVVFLVIAATAAFISALVFTIAPVYRFRTAGLDNFQLVLVGTVMEAAVFVFEIPTGVVADRWSRKWSVIVGHVGIGLGLLIEASFSSFPGVLVGQAVWGLAYTFTSGATVAWLAGELGDPDRAVLRTLFLRASRFGSMAALVAVPLSFVARHQRGPAGAADHRRLPLARPRPVADAGDGGGALRARAAVGPLQLAPAVGIGRGRRAGDPGQPRLADPRVAIFLAGGASEAYDRYVEKFLLGPRPPRLAGVVRPDVAGRRRLHSAVLGIVVPWWFERRHAHLGELSQRRWIVGLISAQVVALLVLAVSGSFLVAAAVSFVIDRVRSLRRACWPRGSCR